MTQVRDENCQQDAVLATPLQQGMIFHDLREPGLGIDIEQITVRSSDVLNRDRVASAFASMLRDNEILRGCFDWETSTQPQLKIARNVSLEITQEIAESESGLDTLVSTYLQHERFLGFKLDVAPLMRVRLFQADNCSVLAWTFHHALLDGRSFAPLLEELFLRYEDVNFSPPLRPRFSAYARWLGERDSAADLAYWNRYLAGVETPGIFPTLTVEKAAIGFGFVEQRLDISETAGMLAQCNMIGVSVNTMLQAAWAVLLHQYTDAGEIVFGATYTTRHCDYAGVDEMMGLLINTLPVRVNLSTPQTARDLLMQLSDHAQEVRPHVLAALNLVQQQAGISGDIQLFDTAVVFDHLDVDAALRRRQPQWNKLRCRYVGQTNFALALVAYGGDRLSLRLEYDHKRIDDEHGGVILTAFRNLLRQFSGNADAIASSMSMLSAEDRQRQITPDITASNQYACLHDTFRRVAAQFPHNIALRCGEQNLSYAALDQKSDLVACALIDAGVKTEDKVGLCMERGNDLIVGILGILKSGCAYVPVDPAYPDTRIEFTLDDAGVEHIVSDLETRDRLLGFKRNLLIASTLEADDGVDSSMLRDRVITDSNLAYVIYTSGSTGTPKGVAVTHHNVSRLISSTQHWFNFGPEDKWTLFHSIAFDWTVFEMWGALSHGGELNVVPYWVSRSPTDFYRLLSENGITVLCQTPSAFLNLQEADEELHETCPNNLKFVIFGGEALELSSLSKWVGRYGDASPRLINMYGITETTVHVTYRRISRSDVESGSPSVIGEPIPDLDILLLNRHAEPVPAGVVAEIHVAGEGLARGYLNQPQLTRERFCEDLAGDLQGIRLYRSGDLARWLPNGDLVYSGRADFQVKIRGFRIELGEIENVIASISGIQQAVVIALTGASGATRLVAYYVAGKVTPSEVSDTVASLLPTHMVPAQVIQLPSLPLTQNGKIDRQQLPDPELSETSSSYAAPTTAMQRNLVEICAQILGLEKIGVEDNFFERGGDSILSIQLISRARKAGITLQARDVYQNPTIKAMALLADEQASSQRIERNMSVGGDIPLLPVQQWFFDTMGVLAHWNQSFSFRLRRPIPAVTLQQALETIARRHPILNAHYEKMGSTWRQKLADGPALVIEESNLDVSFAQSTRQREKFAAHINSRVDLGLGKNICAGLLNFADATQELTIAIHHLVIDGISWNVIVHELDEMLGSLRHDGQLAAAESAPEYVFAEWSQFLRDNAADFINEKTYWEARGSGEAGSIQPAVFRHGGHFHLSQNFEADDWPLRSAVTRQDVVLAAFTGALYSVSAQARVRIDLESHGRSHEVSTLDFANAAGWFTSIFPFAISIPDDCEPLTLLETVHREVRAIPRSGIGYGVLRSRGELPEQSFAQHLFNYMGNFSGLFANCEQLELGEPSYHSWRTETAPHSHPCEWIIAIDDRNVHIDVLYDEKSFPGERIERIAQAFLQGIEATNTLIRNRQINPDKLLVTTSEWEQVSSVAGGATRILPTTPIQDLYLLGSRGNLDIGIEQWYLKIEGALDAELLRRAWQETLQDHTGLCTTFPTDSRGKHLQAFHREASMAWRIRTLGPGENLAEIQGEELSQGLNLAGGPLHRLLLVDAGCQTYYLIWTHHHVHIDGWSWPIILRQIHGRYRQFIDDHRQASGFTSSDYASYVDWLSKSRPKIDVLFWKKYLSELGSDGRLPDLRSGLVGISTRSESFDQRFSSELRKTALKQGVTAGSLYHAAWAYALASLLHKNRVCIGSTFSGRPAGDPDFTGVIGPFVTNLPVRVDIGGLPADKILDAVHAALVGFQDRQFHSPAEIQEASGLPWVSPMFESLVVFQNYQIDDSTFDLGSEVEVSEVFTPVRTNFALTLVIVPDDQTRLDFIYDSARISADFIEDAIMLVRRFMSAIVERRQPEALKEYDYAQFAMAERRANPAGQAAENIQEQKLVEIWRSLFGDDRIGVTDNFFDLGGRSIMVPVLMSRIEAATGTTVPYAVLFREPTVQGLARHLGGATESTLALAEAGRLRADRSKSALRRASAKRARR